MDALGDDSGTKWANRTLLGQNRRQNVITPPTAPGMPAAQQQPYGGAPTVGTNAVAPPQGAGPTTGTPPPADPATLDKWGRPPGHPDYGRPPQGPSGGGSPTWGVPQTPPPPPPPPPPPGTPATYGTKPITNMGSGRGGNYAYTGFDFDQSDQNRLIGKSAKYTFADATREAELAGAGDVWKTKEGAQYFAERYIRPKLEAAGVEVLDIVGDKMFIRDYEDRAGGKPGRWVDFVVNAGGENPKLAWQAEAHGVQWPETRHASRPDAGTSPYGPPSPPPGQTPPPSGGGPADPNDPVTRLLARPRDERLSLADLVEL
jgi:hypothetical protein